MNRTLGKSSLFVVLAVASTASSAQIVNGGFEQPVTTGLGVTVSAGATTIPGWSVLSGSVDVHNTSYFPAYQGSQVLDLDGVSAGSVEQSFSSTPGNLYRLVFAYSNNPGGSAAVSANVSVLGLSGSQLLSTGITHSGSTFSNMNYIVFQSTFTADSATTRLRFTSTDVASSVNGIVIDGVSVTAVPETGTFALFGTGLLALFSFKAMCRRRRAAA